MGRYPELIMRICDEDKRFKVAQYGLSHDSPDVLRIQCSWHGPSFDEGCFSPARDSTRYPGALVVSRLPGITYFSSAGLSGIVGA